MVTQAPEGHPRLVGLVVHAVPATPVPEDAARPTIDDARRCRWSPLHVPTPEVVEALEDFLRARPLPDGVSTLQVAGGPSGAPRDVLVATMTLPAALAENGERASVILDPDPMDRRARQQTFDRIARLCGNVAHELNNLLAGVMGHASLLDLETPSTGPARDALGDLQAAVDRITAFSSDLATFAGRTRRSEAVSDLRAVLGAVVDDARRAWPLPAAIECAVAADLPLVLADPALLATLIRELVANGLEAQASTPGAAILIRAVREERNASATSGWWFDAGLPDREWVVLEVTDRGPGLPATHRDDLFDPFRSSRGRGRGHGLARVLGIVRSVRGRLDLSDASPHGTTVRVHLPIQATRPSTSTAGGAARLASHVLVIDADRTVRDAARRLLAPHGIDVCDAGDADEAFALLSSHPGPIQSVLLDARLGVSHDERVIRRLRAHDARLRIVLLTDHPRPGASGAHATDSCDAVLPKPFGAGALLRAVAQLPPTHGEGSR